LCRATVPQAADIIAAMGANSPASVVCLLRGCIVAHRQAQQHQSLSVATTARKAILALGNLSAREASRIRTILRHDEDTLLDVQLELAARHGDGLELSCLLVQHLSREENHGELSRKMRSWESTHEDDEEKDDDDRKGDEENVIDSSLSRQQQPLQRLIEGKSKLAKLVLEAICDYLRTQREDYRGSVIWSRASIPLRALSCLFFRVSIARLGCDLSSEMDKIMTELRAWICDLKSEQVDVGTEELPLKCRFDRTFSLLLCSTFLAFASSAFLPISDGEQQPEPPLPSCRETGQRAPLELLCLDRLSQSSCALVARFLSAIRQSEPTDWVVDILYESPGSNSDGKSPTTRGNGVIWKQLSMACEWLSQHLPSDFDLLISRGTNLLAFVADASTGLDLIREDVLTENGRQQQIDRVRELLKSVLDEKSEYAPLLLQSSALPDFIEEATVFIQHDDGPTVPLILPVTMERVPKNVTLASSGCVSDEDSRYLIRLMYCLVFKETEPKSSPFVVDPRELPLVKVRHFCDAHDREGISDAFRFKLIEVIDSQCPEVARETKLRAIKASALTSSDYCGRDALISKESLRHQLLKSIEEPASDQSGGEAERLFLLASVQLDESVLFTTAASVFMSEPNSPPLYYTFPGLCRDPLLLLKCPMSIWNRKGLRRIILSILSRLLEINDRVSKDLAPDEVSRQEFLDSRNEVLVRCLLTGLCRSFPSDAANVSGRYCSMTLIMIRKVVVKSRGVIAMMLKQGTTEGVLDSIVEWVPECIEDSNSLANVLSDRSYLTTAERLVAADGILRVALAYGHRNVDNANSLVFSALSQLLSSFFLIIGPTGVPVNTLVGDGTGIDATHVSRRAAFRMLKALANVNCMPQVRAECVLALQKLVGLCKGESIIGSTSGTIANRQKALIKELLDAAVRAANSMGSALQV